MSAPSRLSVLVVARHFRPHVSGATRRLGGLVDGLRARGHFVFVVAPELQASEDGIAVLHPMPVPPDSQVTVPPPTGVSDGVKAFFRTWLLWPDADIRWCRRACRSVMALPGLKFDWVLTSSPPESVHMIGHRLARHFGAKWVADFRDLWFERPLRPVLRQPFRRVIERQFARRVTRHADELIGVDGFIAAEIDALAGAARMRIVPHAVSVPENIKPERFEAGTTTLVHTGSFSLSDPFRRIEPLLDAFQTALESVPGLRLILAGRLSAEENALLAPWITRGVVKSVGVVGPERVAALQAGADGLILVGAEGSAVPPGKWVEYLAWRKPVIVLGDAEWARALRPDGADAASLMIHLASGDRGPLIPEAPTPPSHGDIAVLVEDFLIRDDSR